MPSGAITSGVSAIAQSDAVGTVRLIFSRSEKATFAELVAELRSDSVPRRGSRRQIAEGQVSDWVS